MGRRGAKRRGFVHGGAVLRRNAVWRGGFPQNPGIFDEIAKILRGLHPGQSEVDWPGCNPRRILKDFRRKSFGDFSRGPSLCSLLCGGIVGIGATGASPTSRGGVPRLLGGVPAAWDAAHPAVGRVSFNVGDRATERCPQDRSPPCARTPLVRGLRMRGMRLRCRPLRALALVRRAVDRVPMGGGAVGAGPVLGEASLCAGLQWQGFPPLSVFWHLAIARSSLLRAVPVRGVLSWACARCGESLWELSVEVWESAHWELSV